MLPDLADTETVTVNGEGLAYTEAGAGPAAILVHGGVSDLRTWSNQNMLVDRFRTIAYSRRYARPNAEIKDGADDPIEPHVDDLLALIDALEASPAHLIGHSFGGFIALAAAMQAPELVRSLTLIEPPVLTLFADVPPKPSQLTRLLASQPRTGWAFLKFGATVMAPAQKAFRQGRDEDAIRIFGEGVLGKAGFALLSQERQQMVFDNRKPEKAQMLGAGFPALSEQGLRSMTTPVLLINGANSPTIFHHVIARLAELLPEARRVEIAQASHIVHEDNPSAFNRHVLAFLEETSPSVDR